MILTIEISNTHITIGGTDGRNVLFSSQMATARDRTADEYAVMIRLMLEQRSISLEKIEGCILSSVVPELTLAIRYAIELLTGIRPMVVGPGVKTGLNIRLDDPSELGSDFVAASVAAQALYPLPVITVSMDTAMGIGVTNAKGEYIGGAIAPGLMVSSAALTRQASLLHNIVPLAPAHIIGKNTSECMRSGIIYGAAAMLDGMLEGIEEELGQKASVAATGTWAHTVIPHCRRKNIHIEENLMQYGLWLIWEKNQKE